MDCIYSWPLSGWCRTEDSRNYSIKKIEERLAVNLTHRNILDVPEMVPTVADWYEKEWNVQPERTLSFLSAPNEKIVSHLVIYESGTPVATGGIHHNVNLLNVYPQYKIYDPWMAMVYTVREFRGKGIGKYVCDCLDQEAIRHGLRVYYLYTFTAEPLYLRNGWYPIEKVNYYEHHNTVIMKKNLY
jgi:GNAT superfamily N-acetyltransferase